MGNRFAIVFAGVVFCSLSEADAGPLHDAAKAGDVAQIELLLNQGADINEVSGSGTPLYFAVNTQHAEAAELLIQRGADVNARSTFGMPLHAAAAKDLPSVASLLLEHGADPNADWNTLKPLHIAAKYGRVNVARLLLDHGADIKALTAMDEPALHLAIINKHADVADLLRERGTKTPTVEEIEPLLASADPEHGYQVALPCRGCHSVDREAKPNTGPPLWDIVERPKASYVGFQYSDALKALT